jgi:inorganic triphosphatase YgiF
MSKISDQAPAETEIKLRLDPAAREALQDHPLLSHCSPPEQRHEITTYFDTSDLDLARLGLTLRVRRSGQRRVQTVKATDGHAVAARRGEWAQRVECDTPDLGAAAATPVGDALRAMPHAELRPLFTTDIHRAVRTLHVDGQTTVEVAFDAGSIIADGRSEPVSELELELKHGDPGALYRLAIELAAAAPLAIEPLSKADRGLRLRSGRTPEPVKAEEPCFAPDISGASAFTCIIRSILSHLVANVAPARLGDAEGVHQLRVAIRRMRAALLLFRPLLQPRTADRFRAEFQRVGRVFGDARDWDVFTLETLRAAAAERMETGWIDLLRERAELRRSGAHAGLRRELEGPAFTGVLLGLSGWIEDAGRDPAVLGSARLQEPVRELAPDLLQRIAGKVDRRGRGLENAPREALHELRKAIKKLRYSLEFLGPLYARKDVHAMIGPCKDLQEWLGAVNDAAVTPALAEQLTQGRAELAPAVGALAAWVEKRGQKALLRVPRVWRKLREAEGFWN